MTERETISRGLGVGAAPGRSRRSGLTLVELMVASGIAALLLIALTGVLDQAERARAVARERTELARRAQFAMGRMERAVAQTRLLLLPRADDLATDWPEHVREQTLPPSAPVGSSTFASAVLAVTLPADVDLDEDGTPDADDDGDGRLDEDLGRDNSDDGAPGILGIDDDGDGLVDEDDNDDDDEDGASEEDPANGLDDDGDGATDEDAPRDMSDDGASGWLGVDDDEDGLVDEENSDDDDEDGSNDEDALDPVVFFLSGSTLVERMPVPWDTNGDSQIDGSDFVESPIAENVIRFRVERVADSGARMEQVDLLLELAGADGRSLAVQTRLRVGSAP